MPLVQMSIYGLNQQVMRKLKLGCEVTHVFLQHQKMHLFRNLPKSHQWSCPIKGGIEFHWS